MRRDEDGPRRDLEDLDAGGDAGDCERRGVGGCGCEVMDSDGKTGDGVDVEEKGGDAGGERSGGGRRIHGGSNCDGR